MAAAKLFISYKSSTGEGYANSLRRLLERHRNRYNVWMDTSDLNGGARWDLQIYDEITSRDVVLLLLTRDIEQSEWVRREVDVARGARVYTLPVVVDKTLTSDERTAILNHFSLEKIQYVDYSRQDEGQFKTLIQQITSNTSNTRQEQEKWLAALRRGENKPMFKEPVTPFNPAYRVYTVTGSGAPTCRICLAVGDMTQANNIDVLVNSENNYMQMARIFESFTLSSKLRLHGSKRRADGRLMDDTVQQELYLQIKPPKGKFTIPLEWGCVVPTHAGHVDSLLAQNGARYIFHTVAVKVEWGKINKEEAIIAIDDSKIGEAVAECLRQVMAVNKAEGRILPGEKSLQARDKDETGQYKPIRSIIFPLFATGHGKRQNDIAEIGRLMFENIRQFLLSNHTNPQLQPDSIHVCAYSQQDADTLEDVLQKLCKSKRLKRV